MKLPRCMIMIGVGCFSAVLVAADETQVPLTLLIAGDTMSIKAVDVSLRDVFAEIEHRTGITIRYNPPSEPRLVTAEFSEVNFEEGLKRLLKNFSGYVIVRDTGPGSYSGIGSVYVLGTKGERASPLASMAEIQPIIDAIPQSELPPDLRQLMLKALDPVDLELERSVMAQRAEILNRFIDQVESKSASGGPIFEVLRNRLRELEAVAGETKP